MGTTPGTHSTRDFSDRLKYLDLPVCSFYWRIYTPGLGSKSRLVDKMDGEPLVCESWQSSGAAVWYWLQPVAPVCLSNRQYNFTHENIRYWVTSGAFPCWVDKAVECVCKCLHRQAQGRSPCSEFSPQSLWASVGNAVTASLPASPAKEPCGKIRHAEAAELYGKGGGLMYLIE